MSNTQLLEDARKYFEAKDVVNIKKCFGTLLDSFRETNFLADKTYFHPLGFIYAELIEFSNRDTLRINCWSETRLQQEPRMEIHNHFYDLHSFVVKGEITNMIYKQNNAKEPNCAVYEGAYNAVTGRVLRRTGKEMSIEEYEIQKIPEGELYHLTKDQLHATFVPMDTFTCTFVYSSNRGVPTSFILGPLHGENEYAYSNKLIDKDLVNQLIHSIVK